MNIAANKHRSTVQLLEIELSKAYLYRALRCKDSYTKYIYCAANVYLAALYYTTGQYQTAIDHCTLVTRSQCSTLVVQGEALPKNDDVDVALGLAVFYQHVRTAALNHQHQKLVTILNTQLFAHYLQIKCLLVSECCQLSGTSPTDGCRRYEHCITDAAPLVIGDVLLFLSVTRPLKQKKIWQNPEQQSLMNPPEHSAPDLVELLQRSAVEHLTTFRQLVGREVTTDFEAMYAYKRGDYQRCLQLSTQNVHTLLYASNMTAVLVYPEFIQLMDDELVSLASLPVLISPESRGRFRCYTTVTITQLTLSLYLMTQCQLQLRHSVTSLNQTLNYIKIAQRRHPVYNTMNQLTLKLAERKVIMYVNSKVH